MPGRLLPEQPNVHPTLLLCAPEPGDRSPLTMSFSQCAAAASTGLVLTMEKLQGNVAVVTGAVVTVEQIAVPVRASQHSVGQNAQLLHQADAIRLLPEFSQLATAQAPDVDRTKLKRLACRWVAAQEPARVGAAVRQADQDGVRFCT